MSELVKMKIIGFKKNMFNGDRKEIVLQINPSSLKHTVGIKYAKDKRSGISGNDTKFDQIENSSLSFDTVFDGTGLMPLKEKNAVNAINHLEAIVYAIDGDSHEPRYLQISWGSFLFKGRMSSMNYDYNLFTPDGTPLRVKVSMTVSGYMDKLTEAKLVNRNSPDMSHLITLKSGESIAWWCYRIYGDASYCTDVAQYNHLQSFRNVAPGTQIMFPPLARD
ncbi:MAG: hypothetical protein LBG15_14885 [Dysgonamonadaceae bacterium]|jgi:hypothetical protein|nr:hypothetical protein [Dysgonamonadaceae bacterium]